MKTNININSAKTLKGRLISHSVGFIQESGFAGRLTALFLISALLLPVMYLGGEQKASAEINLSVPQPIASQSAPPATFGISSSADSISSTVLSSASTFNAFLTGGYTSVAGFFTTPQLPEGFAAAKTVSPFSAIISSAGNSLASVFALFAVAKTNETANAAPVAPFGQPAGTVWFDFDGDGKADIGRRRPSNKEWQIKKSTDGSFITATISASGKIAPADYDGNGITDMAVFTASTGTWTISGQTTITGFGQTYDEPVSGDYDGDGIADAAVFRPSNGTWYVRQSNNGNQISATAFGASGDIPERN